MFSLGLVRLRKSVYHKKKRERVFSMIQVDISNVWGELSLSDLLGTEQEVFLAHNSFDEAYGSGDENPQNSAVSLDDWIEFGQILAAAERIRVESDALIVLGTDSICAFSQAVMELLQGPNRNLSQNRSLRVFFAGNSFSTRAWNELMGLAEGKDLSVCILSDARIAPETALAFRSLKWMLERKYGTDEARQRIYAVTGEKDDTLRQMALEEGWQLFTVPEYPDGPFQPLSPEALLPLSAAGIDIRAMLRGFSLAREELEPRSFENPAWLYAAARSALYRKGRHMELLSTSEPGFSAMGRWWQQLFGESADSAGCGAFPVCVAYAPDLRFLGRMIQSPDSALFETMLRFEPPEQKITIGSDLKDLGGLNCLAGKNLDQLYETTFRDILEAHTDSGVPIITIDCGPLNEHTLGQLFRFFQLSCGISARMTQTQQRS